METTIPSRSAPAKAARARLSAFAAALLPLVAVAALSGCSTYPARDLAPGVLESGGGVRVERGPRWIAFVPESPAPGAAGLAFYPGAFVGPEAYAPWLRRLAESGRTAVVAKVPFGIAFLGIGRAGEVMAAYPSTRTWVLGGHSLGGVAAASFAAKALAADASGKGAPGQGAVGGMAFLASYPAGGSDLSAAPWPVLSLSASNDLLATAEDVAKYRPLLPGSARMVVIEGGNHAGFGSYGPQKGDGASSLPAGAQEDRIVAELLALLAEADAFAGSR